MDKSLYSFALTSMSISLFYKGLRENPCISLLVVAGFVSDAIFPLECFSNMAVMDKIVSQRVEFFCALSVPVS